jgi:hypothetical protein
MTLINNVGHSLFSSNVGKGIVIITPAARSKAAVPFGVTPRVVYKLLWHLIKSHRYRIGKFTHAALVYMVFERRQDATVWSSRFLIDHLVDEDTMNFAWADSIITDDTAASNSSSTPDGLGTSTIFRLLRFLPDEYIDKWLSDLARLSHRSPGCATAFASCPDWQPCLFHLVSESVEKISNKIESQKTSGLSGEFISDTNRRFDLALDLYSLLLGHLVQIGGEKV